LLEAEARLRAAGNARSSYEAEPLIACLDRHPVAVPVVPELLWGEIDVETHHRRIVERIWPAIAAKIAPS
jgi:hypothetical protein